MSEDQKNNRPREAVKDMVFCAMCAALIAVCSIITIPVGGVPVTLQTFAVCLTAALLGSKRGTVSVFVYLLLGAVGLPVFAGMKGGVGVLAGMTGGYLIGFLPAALLIGFAAERFGRKILPLSLAMAAGVLACYAFGTIWFIAVSGTKFGEALMLCVVPFLLPDAVKIAVAALLSARFSKMVKL